jgi:hypothetical protein
MLHQDAACQLTKTEVKLARSLVKHHRTLSANQKRVGADAQRQLDVSQRRVIVSVKARCSVMWRERDGVGVQVLQEEEEEVEEDVGEREFRTG